LIDQYEKAAPRTEFPVPGSGTSPMADKLLAGHKPDSMTQQELEAIFVWIDMILDSSVEQEAYTQDIVTD
jgi:hypothetical protein